MKGMRTMNAIWEMAVEAWQVAAQMAPYLLFGFLVAGLVSVFLSPEVVERHLGRRGLWQVVKAALFGVPLPLCSCSVLPVAASLRKHGASRGATLSFLVSTPQTGVDSVLVTHGLLGPVFAAVRVVVAFVSGILSGAAMEWVSRGDPDETPRERACACCAHRERNGRLRRVLEYGFATLPREIGRAMLAGMAISAVLTYWVPDNYFADKVQSGLPAMLLMMAVGIPLYVCSSGSVPIAYALIHMGLSPGAALVFLVTGPATNAAAVATVWKVLGKRATAVYLGSIALTALAAGAVLDLALARGFSVATPMVHQHAEPVGWLGHVLTAVLLAMLAPGLWTRKAKSSLPTTANSASDSHCDP
jgi:uncharacterized membrane protein YraQ (UPF0718 family)